MILKGGKRDKLKLATRMKSHPLASTKYFIQKQMKKTKLSTFTRVRGAQLWKRKETDKRVETNQQTTIIETFNSSLIDGSSFFILLSCLPVSRPLFLHGNRCISIQKNTNIQLQINESQNFIIYIIVNIISMLTRYQQASGVEV